MLNCRQVRVALVCGIAAARCAWAGAVTPSPDDFEFFEKRIRPVLSERCYRCHSARAEKLKGGLLLDTLNGFLKGGDGGPVVTLGQPEKSRLIDAIQYGNVDLQMPPKGRLSDAQIADFVTWVKMGAPWPAEPTATPVAQREGFDWEKRKREHWAWQPIRRPDPPEVKDSEWGKASVDQFILARLEQSHLRPSPPAERPVLLRRLSFDLTGLPPSPGQIEAFVNDPSADAYERIVDALLASPQFGERWARHWLDLVRYSETLGHEFDYPNPGAWKYRDYIIRAFNADVSYNQLVMEHVAGDLLPQPRRHPIEGFNESVIGTAFYWLGQRDHSPVDVRQHQAEVIDNQIDVLSKTFLGLTVACARCHDHKFDAIPSQDYYSLYGILSSSRFNEAAIGASEPLDSAVKQLDEIKGHLRKAVASVWLTQATQAAQALIRDQAHASNTSTSLPASMVSTGTVYADFTQCDTAPVGWFPRGPAFSGRCSPAGEFTVGGPDRPVAQILDEPAIHSGILSKFLQGTLRSPTFTITSRYIHVLAAGRDSRINVPVDDFTMIRDPIYGGLKRILNSDTFQWMTIDVEMWQGHRAYLEFSDISAPDPADDTHRNGFGPSGFVAVRKVVFSDQSQPPKTPQRAVTLDSLGVSKGAAGTEPAELYETAIQQAVRAWRCETPKELQPAQAALLRELLERGLLDARQSAEAVRLAGEYRRIEARLPDPVRIPAMTDGTGLDEAVFVRGNHRMPGEVAPRRFLQAIAGSDQPPVQCGSGRLELAERMVDPSNPLLARVMVNRVWLHLFGRGIVATPDDFGVLGQRPTHPELLDWLADWYRTEGGWSTKKLIRRLVTSSTYCMSSQPRDPVAEEQDPGNLLWHRMPVRRLEGEAIRDSLLALSGRLDSTQFGPPVPIHLTEFMDGRGRPAHSGPLDGAGRRSIYIEVRRNFVSPMMRTFDMPVPFTTVGRRTVSNVPAQSLILMNDPFVLGEAQRCAKALLASPDTSPQDRIRALYAKAFSRLPSATELADALAFLRQQAQAYSLPSADWTRNEQAWTDLCHVIVNVKEFVFLP